MEKNENLKNLAQELKILRAKHNLTQEELAKVSGVSRCAITFIENGKTTARPSTLVKIAKALHIDESSLLNYIL